MKSSRKLHALASAFAAYLLERAGDSINGIYLFGSAARNEATKDSDVDIFVDANKDPATIKAAADRFETTTSAKTFRASGIKNPLRPLVGNLGSEEFADIRLGIAAEGIVLYGKSLPEEKGRKPYLLIWFTAPAKQSKKVAFLRKVFGRAEKGRLYSGLLQNLGGFKAGAGTIVMPIRHRAEFLAVLKKEKVKYFIKNVWL